MALCAPPTQRLISHDCSHVTQLAVTHMRGCWRESRGEESQRSPRDDSGRVGLRLTHPPPGSLLEVQVQGRGFT